LLSKLEQESGMRMETGLAHFWAQGDWLTHAVAILLALLSVASWYVIAAKAYGVWQARRCHARALASFWGAPSLPAAIEAIGREDRSGILASLAIAGANAAELHRLHADRGIGAGVSVSEFVTRALRSQIVEAQASIESGLTFLASVGSTAPFIGLFGTVWGIYHALVGLSGATQVVLDKVAGPVGEALIMTAAGLFVAIPAVLAYNACARGNRLTLARLDGFAHDLHAYLTTGLRGRPGDKLVDLGAARVSRSG
jgi:biopolymer transport protein ExbB